jgi:hypothetical protein
MIKALKFKKLTAAETPIHASLSKTSRVLIASKYVG